jgi:hypothetical protein
MHPSFLSRIAETSRPDALSAPVEIALEDKPVRAAGVGAQLASKSPVVTMAAAKAAAQSREAATTSSVAQSLAPDERREMSALASDDNPVATIKRATARK